MKTSKRHEDHIASIRRGETKLERAGKYWTEEEREQLQKLYEMGEDLTDLMLQFQRYENAILEQLKSLHMLAPTQTPRLRGPDNPRCKCKKCKMKDCPNCGKETYCAGNV